MLANMATSLILHKRITTTLAKAKALRTYVEPLITRSKQDSTHHRRLVFSYLQSKEAVTELFREVSLKVADRPGGYTRIIKLGNRLGDNAEMCLIELVDFNENLLKEKEGEKKTASRSTRRGRRGAGAKAAEAKTETPATPETASASQPEEDAVADETPASEPQEPVAAANQTATEEVVAKDEEAQTKGEEEEKKDV
jgi:large subunit ribosomal protein L17